MINTHCIHHIYNDNNTYLKTPCCVGVADWYIVNNCCCVVDCADSENSTLYDIENYISIAEQSSAIDRCTYMEYGTDCGFNVNKSLPVIIVGEEAFFNSFCMFIGQCIDNEQYKMCRMYER